MKKLHYDGPVVLAILDGVGLSSARSGNAVRQAHMEFLDSAMTKYPMLTLAASGEAVGIMPGQMGNSEVGHNAIGSGQIIKQGIAQVEAAFATGAVWDSRGWTEMLEFLHSAPEKRTIKDVAERVVDKSVTVSEQVVSASEQVADLSEKVSVVAAGAASILNILKDDIQNAGSKSLDDFLNDAGKVALTASAATSVLRSDKSSQAEKEKAKAEKTETAAERKALQTAKAAKTSKASMSDEIDPSRTVHFAGIFSDGGVHSDIKYLEQMIEHVYEDGVRRIRLHAIFDGRDVAPQSEPKFIERIEKFVEQFPDLDFCIASGGGRMVSTADRYENDWPMVKLGWDAMVRGKADRQFTSAAQAIKTLRKENPQVQDQYLPVFVVVDAKGQPVGKVVDGDAFIYYDFRADRAIEIARAFTEEDFDKFNRGKLPVAYFAGLTEYDADKHIPEHTLVPPVQIDTTLNTFLGRNKISQLAVSETVKFGHVTYYFNGNSYKKAPREIQLEIPSDTQPFNTRPWMKSAEITDAVIENLPKYKFIRLNYPGGDMVGHFAELEPTIVAMEAIDLQLARLAKKVDELGGMMIITADHGNAEELLDRKGVPKTSHTSNPVPCIFYDNTPNAKLYHKARFKDPGLTNLAATVATLLGLPDYPAPWQKPLITV